MFTKYKNIGTVLLPTVSAPAMPPCNKKALSHTTLRLKALIKESNSDHCTILCATRWKYPSLIMAVVTILGVQSPVG